jgi:hypothetical protein
MDPEQAFTETALRRITRGMAALAAAGCLACLILRGWKWGLAYLLGAAASCVNFRWLKSVVYSLGAAPDRRVSPRFAILMGLRYALLAAGAYVIVNFTSLSLPAALAGLLVPAAAVILEIVFELIYARSF